MFGRSVSSPPLHSQLSILQEADKTALENKVSRLQFDATMEQLNAMFHELLNKVTDQEQDWHSVMDKLSSEMDCKVGRRGGSCSVLLHRVQLESRSERHL